MWYWLFDRDLSRAGEFLLADFCLGIYRPAPAAEHGYGPANPKQNPVLFGKIRFQWRRKVQWREYIGFPVFFLLLGKSKWFSHFANHLKPNRSTDVCVLLLAVTTADPLAQLEKVAEKFDLPADASFFLKDLCGPTP